MGRRWRGGHGGHHGGSWKVAYADFVTSMMALFMVLWLTGLVTKEQKAALAAYFKDPTVFGQGKGFMPGQERPINFNVNQDPNIRVMPIASEESNPTATATDSIENELNSALQEGKLWPFRDQIQVKETKEGIEVSILEKSAIPMFAMGSAAPTAKTLDILHAMGNELQKYSNHVMIGGHTDANPLRRADGYTNWELSSDRANRARAILETQGLAAARVMAVRGFAETRPLNPAKPFASENRRISIVVLKY